VLQFSAASPTITVNSGLAATGLIVSALIADNAGMTGSIIKAGVGTLALTSPESTFTKGLNLTAGSLMIGAASTGTAPIVTKGPLGTGTLTVSGGTTLLADGTARSLANALSVGGDFAFGGLVPGHSLTFTGATDLGAVTRTITVTNPLVTATLGGPITTTATGTALTKAGAGVLVLSSAANNFNGAAVSITGGILKYGIAAAIPTASAIVVGAGAGLDLNGFDFNPQTQSLTGGGFVTNVGGFTTDNGAAVNLLGVVMIDGMVKEDQFGPSLAKLDGLGIPDYQIAGPNHGVADAKGGTARLLTELPPGQFVGLQMPLQNTGAVISASAGWINDLYADNGPTDPRYGVYGNPNDGTYVPGQAFMIGRIRAKVL
jgi:autotransporter-associated beta strand protein